jgi:YfiH family protein
VPALLLDPVAGVAGAVHCGLRSSVADILQNALAQMESLGARRENVRAAMGAAIGACCFETDDDVPAAIEKYLGGDTAGLFVRRTDGKTLVDLRGANKRRLLQLGLKEEHIDLSDECTFCSHEKYWSHRYTKGKRGSQAACIVLE